MGAGIEVIDDFLVRKGFVGRRIQDMTVRGTIDRWCVRMRNLIDSGVTILATNLAMVSRFEKGVIDIKKSFACLAAFLFGFVYSAKAGILVTHGAIAFDFSQADSGEEQQDDCYQ